MLALVYLFVMVALGDAICRRFYSFVSLPHRFAAAFISGLLISSWATYGAAWLFSGFSSPMLWGNLVYFITAIGVILWFRQMPGANINDRAPIAADFEKWDWVVIGIFFLFVCWMAFATLDMTDGRLQIAHHQWSDFGSNISIMQSFAMGNNFPTEYPHYSGERIHYHFLFYFQAGNLEYLGLSPATANNVLFIFSTISMLVLVMTLGAVVFTSKVVGRVAAAIFFFHGSLSFIPWLYSRGLSGAWTAISTTRDFLPSGFNYRGETWGVWSQVVFINQRHLASSVGIFLVVLVFILLRYREAQGPAAIETPQPAPQSPAETVEEKTAEPAQAGDAAEPKPEKPKKAKRGSRKSAKESTDLGDVQKFAVKSSGDETEPSDAKKAAKPAKPSGRKAAASSAGLPSGLGPIWPWIFSGLLLGLMPMWNGAVFTAAAAVLAVLLVLFPLRRQMFILGVTAGIIALPQVLFLRTGNMTPGPSLFHWGYTIDDPGIFNVFYYLLFTFGFKWLLIAVAIIVTKGFQRRFFIAITVLIAVAFCMQFSDEVLANHKFLNVWLIMANVFAAFGLWYIWKLEYLKSLFLGKILAAILTVLITVGGIVDLFPIRNSFWMELGFVDDPLVKWVTEKTDPKSVFLSFRYVNHRILLAGRRLFFGHPYYAWSAGYPTHERDGIYRRMFEETNQNEVLRMLKENNISYVAIDNQLRNDLKNHNEATVYAPYFQRVFDDTENKYDSLKIYQVPPAVGAPNPGADPGAGLTPGTGTNAFTGGSGSGAGQFTKPRGITADAQGNIYIADLGNSRVQKFDAEGKFVASFGTAGEADGQFKEPNGVVADASGNVYAVDALNHKLMKFTADGKFVKEWKGPPENTLYGPRDLAIGPNKQLYIVDQGRGRIVRFDPAKESFTEFGTLGAGEGQFHEATGIAIAGNFVVVADGGNNRIEVFDLDGKFIRQWNVPMWQYNVDPWHYPDVVYDEQAKKLYASSGWTQEVLAYDLDGNIVQGGFKPDEPNKFDNPSSLVISEANKKRRLLVLNTGGNKISVIELEAKAGK